MSARARPSLVTIVWSCTAAVAVATVVWWKLDVARVDAAIDQTHAEIKTLAVGGRVPSTPAVAAFLTERGRAVEAHHLGARQWLTVSSDALAAGVDPQLFFQQRVHEMHLLMERLSAARKLTVPAILGVPKELPPSDAVPRFLAQVRLVEELADVVFAETGVTRIESFKVEDPQALPPPGEHAVSYLTRLPVRVRLSCAMESLAKILGRLERVRPLMTLEALQLAALPESGLLAVDLLAARYLVTAELRTREEAEEAEEIVPPARRAARAPASTRSAPRGRENADPPEGR